jgi:tetratricopeptide (TPR) repeat protein
MGGTAGALQAEIGLGQFARQPGNRKQALAHFAFAALIDAKNIGAKLEIAVELRDLGRYDEAEQVISSVLAVDPSNLGARPQRAHLHRV